MTSVSQRAVAAASEEAAAQILFSEGKTDGLPIVVPTVERVEAMLANSGGLDADAVIGDVAPAAGRLTVENAAINAVMAGCQPEIFPLVIAVCEAVTDPLFDLGPIQSTTHCVTPFIIVNGPARKLYGVQWGVGALGPGHRTNVTLGRALRFVMLNVGGGIPGLGDMATLGSPAKIACCMAEAEEESPFEPLHVSRGFKSDDSTVTVLGVEGPHSVFFDFDDTLDGADLLCRCLGAGFASPITNSIYFGKGNVAAVLNPVHARTLGAKGWSRRDVQERLFDYATSTREALLPVSGGRMHIEAHQGDVFRVVERPEDFIVIVGGEEGGAYSAIFPSWCGGRNGQIAVTKRVRTEDFCEIPASLRSEIDTASGTALD